MTELDLVVCRLLPRSIRQRTPDGDTDGGRSLGRAANEGPQETRVRAFSWLKAATTAFTFKTLC